MMIGQSWKEIIEKQLKSLKEKVFGVEVLTLEYVKLVEDKWSL